MPILKIENLVKQFADVRAVDDLSFAVEPGEVFGFLGGNGAGKTTSLRMVLDIIRPTSGRIEVFGSAPGHRNASQIGFLPEERGLYTGMSAIDTIIYFGKLKGMTGQDARSKGLELLGRFELDDRAKSDVGDMSKGMAQKVQLATSLVNEPQLLMLDEPFSGLDPVNQGLLEAEILRASKRGAAVIFSTHVMQHAERLCDRLLLLKKGHKRFEGTLDEARSLLPTHLTAITQIDPNTIPGVARASPVENGGGDGGGGGGWKQWDITLDTDASGQDVLEYCTMNKIGLRGWSEHHASLHEVFVELVGDEEVKP